MYRYNDVVWNEFLERLESRVDPTKRILWENHVPRILLNADRVMMGTRIL
jgi:hypothetical protein